MGGPELKRCQTAVDKAIAAVDDASETVGKAEVDAKSAAKNAKKAEAAHAKAEKELTELRAEQEVTTKEFKQLEEDAFSVMGNQTAQSNGARGLEIRAVCRPPDPTSQLL